MRIGDCFIVGLGSLKSHGLSFVMCSDLSVSRAFQSCVVGCWMLECTEANKPVDDQSGAGLRLFCLANLVRATLQVQ